MNNVKRLVGVLAVLIVTATVLRVIYVRSKVAQQLTDKTIELQSLQEREPNENGPKLAAKLTYLEDGAELKEASRVVVLLHGLGDNARNFSRIRGALTMDEETCFIFPNAPIERRPGYAWFRGGHTYQPSREKVVQLLTHIKDENPSANIVLGGFSQGAMMSSNFLEKDVELVSAIVLLAPSGRLRDDISGKAKRKPPVFLSHGRSDRVLPFEGSEQLYKKLVRHEYPVEWVPFDEGHVIPHEILDKLDEFLIRTKETSNQE